MRRFVLIQGGKTNNSNLQPTEEISIMRKRMNTSCAAQIDEKDKEEIIQMIEFGWNDDQILQMLPHVERGSITAFRAHVTRGTYEPGERVWHHLKSS